MNFWSRWVFLAACDGLFLVVVSGGYSPGRCMGFSLQCLLWLGSTGSGRAGLSNCASWALVAPRHMESSLTWFGRQILIHCTTREVRVLQGSMYSFWASKTPARSQLVFCEIFCV